MPSVSIGFILKYNKPLVFSITNIRESIKNFYHINVSVPMAVMCMGRVRAAPRAGEHTWPGMIETDIAFRVSVKYKGDSLERSGKEGRKKMDLFACLRRDF